MNEEDARKARAERLRKQIKQIVTPDTGEAGEQPASRDPSSNQVTPREFIHRRMHELDRDTKPTSEESKDKS
ncbi:hypothetical protein ACFSKY_03845 [Azotobacter chroococcum]|jgi:prophage antirepressor-like protein|uniref:hypothetical protein n=1 Tax=Azotobacter chroococcum TaxID=353 RepID=UPI00103AD84F|nr:hypothetical protein [Azotobacter chroococcum]TBV98566.1 hypothetical protein E0E53_05970 [Azotobacter chroococcum]